MTVLLKIQGLAALLLFCAAAGAEAQNTSGVIAGRVRDTQGLVVPGVTVTVSGSQGSRTAVTDDRGAFTVPFLTPGTYRLRVELTDVDLAAGQLTFRALEHTPGPAGRAAAASRRRLPLRRRGRR